LFILLIYATIFLNMANEFDNLQSTADQSSDSSSDFLQEKSDLLSQLQERLKKGNASAQLNFEGLLPSQMAEMVGAAHIANLEVELAEMRAREDYGIPVKDKSGNDVEKDIVFIRTPAKMSEEDKALFND
jgi:hypothetical protein